MLPVAGSTFTFGVTLADVANPGLPKFAPTLDAVNDFRISINGGAYTALTNAPTVSPAGGPRVQIVLAAAETTAAGANGRIALSIYDSAGNEWYGLDMEFPVLSVALDTQAASTYSRIGAPVGASISADIASVQADTDNIQTRIPAALVSGRIDASVGAMATDVITSTALATSAVTEIQTGLATPTNITAGTITTVTNLTNAPTTGDLTATMKASVTAAATAATPTAAAVTAAVTVGTINANVVNASALATDAVTELVAAIDSTSTKLATLIANVALILGQTGTNGVVISTAIQQAIADEVLKRSASNVEATASPHSLVEVILGLLESSAVDTTWNIHRTDGVTPFSTRTLTQSASALPVTGVS